MSPPTFLLAVLLAVLCTSKAFHVFTHSNGLQFSGGGDVYNLHQGMTELGAAGPEDWQEMHQNQKQCTATMCCPAHLDCGPFYTCISGIKWVADMTQCLSQVASGNILTLQ